MFDEFRGHLMASARQEASEDTKLALAARDDPQAFLGLYERYIEQVYRYCLVRLEVVATAEDATSEVFLKALDRLHAFRGGSFPAWLFAIARNVVADHYRRRRHEPLDAAARAEDQAPTAVVQAQAAERRQAIHDALTALSKDQRDLIELQLAGWSDREIAAALCKSSDAVKMLRYRAMQRLRDRLTGSGWDSRDWLDG